MSNLEDIKRKPVFIKLLDGREADGTQKYEEIEVLYSLAGFAYLEEKYGSVEAAMNAFDEGKIKPIQDVLYAGLLYSDTSLTPLDLARRLDIRDLQGLAKSLSALLKADTEPSTKAPNA